MTLALLLLAAHAQALQWKGVLEGFYGKPWTWDQRREMAVWMASRGFNVLALAPKDEPWQRRLWREPFPPAELRELGDLVKIAGHFKVSIAVALSPLGARLEDDGERRAAAAKLRSAAAVGVRRFLLAFDDTPAKPAQVDFANAVLREVLAEAPEVEFVFVPAEYWGDSQASAYFDRIRDRLDPRFSVGFTGPQIISRRITAQDCRAFAERVGRKLVLGDNYPVQDRLEGEGRLLLGPLMGREPEILDELHGYAANASPFPEASKIGLATAADFLRDPRGYSPSHSWERSLRDLGGPALLAFGRAAPASWLSGPIELSAGSLPLRELTTVDAALRRSSPALFKEISPWAEKLAAGARLALDGRSSPDWSRKPPVVAELSLDRRFNGAGPSLSSLIAGYCRDGSAREALAAELDRLAEPGRGSGPAEGFRRALADSARRARSGMKAPLKPRSSWERLWAKRHLLGLAAAKSALDGDRGLRPRLIAAAARVLGSSFPLDRAELEALPGRAKELGLPEEFEPWLHKIASYAAGKDSGSANGLEMGLELLWNLELVATGRCSPWPPDLPANPAEMF